MVQNLHGGRYKDLKFERASVEIIWAKIWLIVKRERERERAKNKECIRRNSDEFFHQPLLNKYKRIERY